jgi:hypothetical protein
MLSRLSVNIQYRSLENKTDYYVFQWCNLEQDSEYRYTVFVFAPKAPNRILKSNLQFTDTVIVTSRTDGILFVMR